MSRGRGAPTFPLCLGALQQSQGVIMAWPPPCAHHLHWQCNIIHQTLSCSSRGSGLSFIQLQELPEWEALQTEHMAGVCNGLNHLCEIHQSSFCQGALCSANEIFMKCWASLINISLIKWQCWVESSASIQSASPTSPSAVYPAPCLCHRTLCSLWTQGKSHLADR